MKKFFAFVSFLIIAALVGAYFFVPASVTVKFYDDSYSLATPKGESYLTYKLNNVVNDVGTSINDVGTSIKDSVKESTKTLEEIKKNVPINEDSTLDNLPPELKKQILDTVKNFSLSDAKVSAKVNDSESVTLSDSEKENLMELLKNGDVSELMKKLDDLEKK